MEKLEKLEKFPEKACEECGHVYVEEECPRCAEREAEAADEAEKIWIMPNTDPVELTNDQGVRFVNIYFVQRCFGGREEGGWYFDCGEILRVIVVPNESAAQEIKSGLDALEFSNKGRRPLSSVHSDGEFRVTIDLAPGVDWPREKPRYE